MKQRSLFSSICWCCLGLFFAVSAFLIIFSYPNETEGFLAQLSMPSWQLHIFYSLVLVAGLCGLLLFGVYLWMIFLPPVSANGLPLTKISAGKYFIISCDFYCGLAYLVLDGTSYCPLLFNLPISVIFRSGKVQSISCKDNKYLIVREEMGYYYFKIETQVPSPNIQDKMSPNKVKEGMPVSDSETLSADSVLAAIEE